MLEQVIKLQMGLDNISRVALLHTKHGVITKSVTKLFLNYSEISIDMSIIFIQVHFVMTFLDIVHCM